VCFQQIFVFRGRDQCVSHDIYVIINHAIFLSVHPTYRQQCLTLTKPDFLVQVGLGTDCSGGYSPSMLDSMRLAVLASNTIHCSKRPPPPLTQDKVRPG
jgi:hypothetical protein